MRVLRHTKYIAAAVLMLGIASLSRAAIIAPNYQMTMQIGNSAPYGLDATAVPLEDGKFQIDGSYDQHGYHMTVHFVVDPDPSIVGNVAITNLTTIPQDYSFAFTLPVAPAFSPSLLNGSVGLTATADSTAGAVSSVSPDSIYSALIDGSTVKTLLNHPFTLPVAAFDSNVTTAKFGIPTPDAGGAVNTSIGIKLHFNVTPGDQAGITSQFTANPVPEPTTLMGLALGGLVLARRRK